MSATRSALNALAQVLGEAAGTDVEIVPPGAGTPEPRPAVWLSPLSLTRVGRSRSVGAQLDLALTVAVHTAGDDVLDLTERLLAAAEQTAHLRIEPLPVPAEGFGFLVTVAVGVPLAEPSGPPVKESVVHLHPLATITGTVVDPAGVALPNVEVHSSLTRQQTTTDAAGRFALQGLPSPTTLTLHRGSHRTSLDVPGPATELRIVLPTHEGS